MYKYTCKCGYRGDYLVPYYNNNTTRCPRCGKEFRDIRASDVELLELKCPQCGKENSDEGLEYYMTWKTCEHCGRNFEASKKVRYFIR